MAIFKIMDSEVLWNNIHEIQESYQLAETIDFPYFEESGFSDQVILEELIESAQNIVFRKSHLKNADQEFELETDELWAVLRNRQLCKRRTRMEEIISSDLGQKSFLRRGSRLKCLFDFAPRIEELNLDEQEFIPEWNIHRSDTAFQGWGEAVVVNSSEIAEW